jgi:hypothetical protein
MNAPAPAAKLLPEHELLLACARRQPAPEQLVRIRALLAGPIDWVRLLPLAQRHGLLTLLGTHLNAVASDQVPEVWRAFLRRYMSETSRRNINLTAAMLETLEALESAGVRAVPYKGPVLAHALYGNLVLRQFSDVDLLVRQRDIPRAVPVLEQLGYQPDFHPTLVSAEPRPAPGQYGFRRPERQQVIELHTERTLRYFPVPPDFDRDWRRLEEVDLGGRAVPSLPAEDLLLYLAVHGGKDFWARLAWICDLAELVDARPGLDWEVTLDRARKAGAERILLLGLALARNPAGARLPAAVERQLSEADGVEWLAERVRERLYRGEADEPGLFQRIGFRTRMRGEGWRGLAYSLRLAFSPTEEDLRLVRVPGALAPLYTVLRPLRLVGKYGLARAKPSFSWYEGTPHELIDPLLSFAEVRASDVLFELGCGDGRCVIAAGKRLGVRGVGVDVDRQLIERARAAAREQGVHRQVRFRVEDARKTDISSATVLLLYLPSLFNLRLRSKLQRELRPGARIIARGAHMGDWQPEETCEFVDDRGVRSTAYRWRI